MKELKVSGNIDNHTQAIAEYITKNGLNFCGGEFEYIETGEAFTITIARESAINNIKEENAKLKREIFKLTSLVNELFSDDESSYDAAFELSEYIDKIKGKQNDNNPQTKRNDCC